MAFIHRSDQGRLHQPITLAPNGGAGARRPRGPTVCQQASREPKEGSGTQGRLHHGERFANYVQTLIDRDIRDLSGIERGADLNRLLQLVAARTGQLLVARALSSDLTISARTTLRYLDLCEEIFLIKTIPAWSSNLGKRAISTPKVAFVDSGVAAYLLGQDEKRLANIEGPLGPLLEGFVLMELALQIEWAGSTTVIDEIQPAPAGSWRSSIRWTRHRRQDASDRPPGRPGAW